MVLVIYLQCNIKRNLHVWGSRQINNKKKKGQCLDTLVRKDYVITADIHAMCARVPFPRQYQVIEVTEHL